MLVPNFNPFPVLETKRLVLRRPVMADVDEMFIYRSDKMLMQYIPHRLATQKQQVVEMLRFINNLIDKNEGINWAITLKGNDIIIGMVGYVHFFTDDYRAEIGYMLHTPYHGKGIIHEAMKAAMDYGFNVLKLHSIEAIVNCENVPSKKVLERIGFSKDAFFKDYLFHDGKFIDANVYSFVKSE